MKNLYPKIEPFDTGFLKVDDIHEIYFEQCGNKNGKLILFLHGGPGSNIKPSHRQFFDPKVYRIILFDQRGAGKSKPFAELKNNTTWDLVKDIEKLRKHLNIDKWVVFGGSWGSTLSLVYAINYPTRVKGLILRGIFLVRKLELDWFFKSGANLIYPDEWEKVVNIIPLKERNNLIKAYLKRLTSNNKNTKEKAAIRWSSYEAKLASVEVDEDFYKDFTKIKHAIAVSTIEAYYFYNKAFFKSNNYILDNINKIKNIPTIIIHGRYDMVCPVKNAIDLNNKLKKSKLVIVPKAGHLASEEGIKEELLKATENFKKL
jgi:proline iminopeptidase